MKKIRLISIILATAILVFNCSFGAFAVVEGDCDANGKCESDDAIYLLYHVFFGNDYPLPKGMSGDFDDNGSLNANDAIYLLYHVFFPDDYPFADEKWTQRY